MLSRSNVIALLIYVVSVVVVLCVLTAAALFYSHITANSECQDQVVLIGTKGGFSTCPPNTTVKTEIAGDSVVVHCLCPRVP